MALDDLQQSELVRSTANLIYADGIWLQLLRAPAWVDDGAGGRVRAPGPLTPTAPQRVHKAGVNAVTRPVSNDEGTLRVHEFVLVGMPYDAHGLKKFDVQIGDQFDLDNDRFKVFSLHHDRSYQIKALCNVVGV